MIEMVSHKGMDNNQDVFTEVTMSVYVIAREAVENGQEESNFCPQVTRTNPSSSFLPIPQKEISKELEISIPESLLWPTKS